MFRSGAQLKFDQLRRHRSVNERVQVANDKVLTDTLLHEALSHLVHHQLNNINNPNQQLCAVLLLF